MIVDFHTHVFPALFRDQRSNLFAGEPAFETIYSAPKAQIAGDGELLREMDRGQVQRSVIFGFPWEKADNYRRHNDYILAAVHRHPERLTGFCCFSPSAPGGPREAERCLEAGLAGVGELAVYRSSLSSKVIDALQDVMSICSRMDVPVLMHTNEPVGHQYPGKAPMTLSQIYAFLQAFPRNQIVLAHWGGGLLFYGLMKKEVREVLRNVWFDTAASPFLYQPAVYRIAGELVGYGKILFGSDYPLIKPERYLTEIAAADLPARAAAKITGANAIELLRLTR